MNTPLKIGVGLLVLAFVLRVGEELAWPPISQIPFGSPAKLPLLTLLTLCVLLVPILVMVGAGLAIFGAVNNKK